MSTAAQVLVFVVAGGFLALVVWLVRQGSLKEKFALVWLGVGAGLVVLALVRPLVDDLSNELGIESGTTTLFLLSTLFLAGLLLHLSIVVSRLEEKLRDLTEAYALLVGDRDSGEPAAPISQPDEG